ncbi:MAG: DUF2007 domain-containing protein [Usitatibacter sp.]
MRPSRCRDAPASRRAASTRWCRCASKLKRILSASNLPEAILLVDLLLQHGIRARVFNANASSIMGELPIEASLPQVWVDDSRAEERARALIEDYQRRPHLGPPVRCPRCSEDNPSSFELCWACGTPLPNY